VAANGRVPARIHSAGTPSRHAVFSAPGAWADRLAVKAGARPVPPDRALRGAYRGAAARRHALVSAPYLPGAPTIPPFPACHLTRHIGGEGLIGPTALMAVARDSTVSHRAAAATCLNTLSRPEHGGCSRTWGRNRVRSAVMRRCASTFVRAAARSSPAAQPLRRGALVRRSATRLWVATASSSDDCVFLPPPAPRCTCATPPSPGRDPPR